MKTQNLFLIILLLSISISIFAQKLTIEKASPFTVVKWKKEQPIVKFEGEWYHFEKLENFTKDELLGFCKKEFGHKWQKRFSEDLVGVLYTMKQDMPNVQVSLQLSKNGISKQFTGTFTADNREKVRLYNRNKKKVPKTITLQQISKENVIADVNEFEEILEVKSSYKQLSSYNYKESINKLKQTINNKKGLIDINYLTNELGKIMAEFGDRHSSIRNRKFNKKEHPTYQLQLPFGIISVENNMIAVNPKDNSYYDKDFPYIISINEITIEDYINKLNYRDKKAPKEAKLTSGAKSIQHFGALLFNNTIECPNSVTIALKNKQNKTKTVTVNLVKDNTFNKVLDKKLESNTTDLYQKNFNALDKKLEGNIGYIAIPMMSYYTDINGLENYLHSTISKYQDAKALIIDIRNNPGGGREILQTFASYLVQPSQSPWVANVAYLRTEDSKVVNNKSMNARYLYTYNSEKFTDSDRKTIDAFNKTFKIKKSFNASKFSKPHYMVLKNGKETYKNPVYILVNENSFSAASVFTSVFKGLPNVKIAGVTTDGSSGNSKRIYLSNSGIRVKVSTMLSFQRNGKTLDGNGTIPDIYIPINESQILTNKDVQLEELLTIINQNNE